MFDTLMRIFDQSCDHVPQVMTIHPQKANIRTYGGVDPEATSSANFGHHWGSVPHANSPASANTLAPQASLKIPCLADTA